MSMGWGCVLLCERGSDGAETATWSHGWRRKEGSYFLSEQLLLTRDACFVLFFFSDNAVRKSDQSRKQQTKLQNTRRTNKQTKGRQINAGSSVATQQERRASVGALSPRNGRQRWKLGLSAGGHSGIDLPREGTA